ncbi:MAG: hypothetical protein OXC99_11050 [Chloroflexi bacterium]|nr:hypothetical protein [Chloroflexota bacterium]
MSFELNNRWSEEDYSATLVVSELIDDPWEAVVAPQASETPLFREDVFVTDEDYEAPLEASDEPDTVPLVAPDDEADESQQGAVSPNEAEEDDETSSESDEVWDIPQENAGHTIQRVFDPLDDPEWSIVTPEDLENDRQPIFVPRGDLNRRELDISMWLSGIDGINETVKAEVMQTLLLMSSSRFGRWFSWLKDNNWNGRSLDMFLAFRSHWSESEDLWGKLTWRKDPEKKRAWNWETILDYRVLTLDKALRLINSRIDCAIYEIINEEWVEDWDNLNVWTRVDNGLFSLVDFAVYRAQLHEAEDWQYRPDLSMDLLHIPKSKLPGKITTYEDIEEFRQDRGAQSWFARQDWHDPVDWHDGLGW